MTLRTFLFNVTPDDTALNTSNILAKDGTPANLVNSGSGNTTRSSSTHAKEGSTSLKFTSGGTSSGETRLPFVTADTQVAFSVYRWVDSAVSMVPFALRSAAGQVLRIGLSGTNKAQLLSGTGATLAASADTVVENRWNRFDVVIDTVAGTASVKVYNGDATGTPDAQASVTGASFGSVPITLLSLGSPISTVAGSYWYDVAQLSDGVTAAPGPYVATNQPPVVTVPDKQSVAAGAVASVTATATDPDGTIASYAWTVLYSSDPSVTTGALSGAATTTASFSAPPVGNLIILQCVVTDNGGASTTVTSEVRVPTSGAFTVLPGAGLGSTGWTNTGGAATEGAALSDASDSTYMESPVLSGTATTRKYRLQPLTSRSSLTLTSRTALTVTGGTVKVRLLEGVTVRQEWDVTQSTSVNDEALALTSPGAIADWGNLWVEYSAAA